MKIKPVIATAAVFAILIIAILNSQQLYSLVIPVEPEVTSLDIVDRSSLLDYKVSVDGFVSNHGGNGDVIVTVMLYQGAYEYEKNVALSLTADAGENFSIDFPEVKILNGNVSCEATVRPVGR